MDTEFPRWAAEEIAKAKLVAAGGTNQTGYILEIDEKGRKIDVQFYDALPAGNYVATLELAEAIPLTSLNVATNYMFEVKIYQARFSEKLIKFLAETYQVKMESVHRYVLKALEELDIGAVASPTPAQGEDEE